MIPFILLTNYRFDEERLRNGDGVSVSETLWSLMSHEPCRRYPKNTSFPSATSGASVG